MSNTLYQPIEYYSDYHSLSKQNLSHSIIFLYYPISSLFLNQSSSIMIHILNSSLDIIHNIPIFYHLIPIYVVYYYHVYNQCYSMIIDISNLLHLSSNHQMYIGILSFLRNSIYSDLSSITTDLFSLFSNQNSNYIYYSTFQSMI